MAQVITTSEFDSKVLKAEGKVLVDFFATWCGPCKMLAPVLDQASTEIASKGAIYKVDVDESREIANQFQIMSVPTLILFEDGKPVKQIMGAQPKQNIVAMFN